MRAILGLLEPTYGRIEVGGVDIRERPEDACRLVGFMPDFPPLYEDLMVWEFLDLFAACYYVPKKQRPDVIESHLHLVDLWEKRDAFVGGLSRGMRQRLVLAKTLIPDPQVLMLDEPASGLDPHGRIDLKNIIKKLSQRGKSVLVSSHILSEMSEFCTAIGIMERGRMVVTGGVEEITRDVMGHAVISMEILDKAEALLSLISRDKLAGPAMSWNRSVLSSPTKVPEQVSELLAKLVAPAFRSSCSAGAKKVWKKCFCASAPRKCPDSLHHSTDD